MSRADDLSSIWTNHGSATQARTCVSLPPPRYTFTQCSEHSPHRNGEEVVIAKKRKDGWSVRATGDFDDELLGNIFDELDSEEIQLDFEVQDVLQELLIKAEVNARAREIIWEDGQNLLNFCGIGKVGTLVLSM